MVEIYFTIELVIIDDEIVGLDDRADFGSCKIVVVFSKPVLLVAACLGDIEGGTFSILESYSSTTAATTNTDDNIIAASEG